MNINEFLNAFSQDKIKYMQEISFVLNILFSANLILTKEIC